MAVDNELLKKIIELVGALGPSTAFSLLREKLKTESEKARRTTSSQQSQKTNPNYGNPNHKDFMKGKKPPGFQWSRQPIEVQLAAERHRDLKLLHPLMKQVRVELVAEVLGLDPLALITFVKTKPAEVSKRLGLMNTEQRRKVSLATSFKTEQAAITHAILSSSWLEEGWFKPIGATLEVGDLTLRISGETTHYTYYSVPYSTWIAMTEAKGSNGSGAGTVFWALYLRSRKASPISFFPTRRAV